ncbi:MAG: sulfurtransferase TusA family protein [Miltoncostaeaceae bacterium]
MSGAGEPTGPAAPSRVVDALGTWCPVPIRLLDRAARGLRAGAVLDLLATDPLIRVDLPAWCHRTGHELVWLREVEARGRDEFAARVRLTT